MTPTTKLFDLRCPLCDKAVPVPETILGDIAEYLEDSSTDADQLKLVCPACKRCFDFDYRHRSDKAVGHEPLPLRSGVDHAWFAISGECGPDNPCLPITLIAIRPRGTNGQELERELPSWSAHGISCENGHPIVSLSLL